MEAQVLNTIPLHTQKVLNSCKLKHK